MQSGKSSHSFLKNVSLFYAEQLLRAVCVFQLLDNVENKMKGTCVEGTIPKLFRGKMVVCFHSPQLSKIFFSSLWFYLLLRTYCVSGQVRKFLGLNTGTVLKSTVPVKNGCGGAGIYLTITAHCTDIVLSIGN